MSRKDKLIFEDLTVQGNRWQQDPSGKTNNPRMLSLLDLVKMAKPDEQNPNFVPAAETPIHGSQHFVELLGDLHVQVAQLEGAIRLVGNSPILKNRSSSIAQIETMKKKAIFIKKLIKSIGDDIDNFSVEKSVK